MMLPVGNVCKFAGSVTAVLGALVHRASQCAACDCALSPLKRNEPARAAAYRHRLQKGHNARALQLMWKEAVS